MSLWVAVVGFFAIPAPAALPRGTDPRCGRADQIRISSPEREGREALTEAADGFGGAGIRCFWGPCHEEAPYPTGRDHCSFETERKT